MEDEINIDIKRVWIMKEGVWKFEIDQKKGKIEKRVVNKSLALRQEKNRRTI